MLELLILAVFLFILFIGGLIADYIFPYIGALNRFIDNLPMMQDGKAELETSRKEYIA